MNEYQFLKVELQNSIATISFNNSEKANALNGQMWNEVQAVFQWLDQEPQARVAIVKGEGKHFCSGIDVSFLMEMAQSLSTEPGRRSEELRRKILSLQEAFNWAEKCRKPILAAIQGACIGGAIDMVAAFDMRYCSADARFSIREIDMGMVADVGTLQRLPSIIGEGMLRELAYTGKNISGEEAAQIGLVNRCYPDSKSMYKDVEKIAQTIAAKSPLAIRGLKQVMLYNRDHSVAEGLDYIATWNSSALLSKDLAESISAFFQKSTPSFDD